MNQFTVEADSSEHFIKSCHSAIRTILPAAFEPYQMVMGGKVLQEMPIWKGRQKTLEDLAASDSNSEDQPGLEEDFNKVWNRIVDGIKDEKLFSSFAIQERLSMVFLNSKDQLGSVADFLSKECFIPLFCRKLDTFLESIWLKYKQKKNFLNKFHEFISLAQRFMQGYPLLNEAKAWIEKNSGKRPHSYELHVWEMHETMRDRILDTYQSLYLEYVCIQEMEHFLFEGKTIRYIKEYDMTQAPIPDFIKDKKALNDVYMALIYTLVLGVTKDTVTNDLISFRKTNGEPNKSRLAEFISHKNGTVEQGMYQDKAITVIYSVNHLKNNIFPNLDWGWIEQQVALQKKSNAK